jgi:Tat protein secretion system quality control protein TatD with DNase activity
LHTSGAEEEILHLLNRYTIERAIIHWYAGPLDTLRALTDRGYHFTIGVEVMHSERAKAIARELPSQLLLTETDNPGGLEWVTGTCGTPALIKDVVQTLAEVRETTIDDIVETVQANFLALIDKDLRLADTYRLVSGSTRDKE